MDDINIVIIASGNAYQEAAALSASTYKAKAGLGAETCLLIPKGEALSPAVEAGKRSGRFGVVRFPFRLVSDRKFTSQLKCQAFVFALSFLPRDTLIVVADADTCCLGNIVISSELADSIREGRIGMAADIEDRHFKSPGDPWFLSEEERLTYVNSGVVLASHRAMPMFRRFRALSEQPRFLQGPFNDQKVINFALGKYFRDGLAILDRRYNHIGPPFTDSTVIAHFAGGAGYLGQQRRKLRHQNYCELILNGSGFSGHGLRIEEKSGARTA